MIKVWTGHPEAKAGEVLLGVVPRSVFHRVAWDSARPGNEIEDMPDQVPIFAAEREIEAEHRLKHVEWRGDYGELPS